MTRGISLLNTLSFLLQQRCVPSALAENGRAFTAEFKNLGVFVKWGPDVQIREALSMRALRKIIGGKVPIPEIFGWRHDQNDVFIYMQLVRGPNLQESWNELNENAKVAIIDHLREIITSFRSVKQGAQAPFIGTLAGEFLHTYEFEFKPKPTDPLRSVGQFGNWFTGLVWRDLPRGHDPFATGVPDHGEIKLTHGDLHPKNIMISPTSPRKVLALVDWEYSGWYPDYWEYCKMRRLSAGEDWDKRIPSFVEARDDILDYVWSYLDWIGAF